MKQYRRDIQVLRGISIVSVVLFHAKEKYFPNGYLGVDAFFVISGFVVTPLIIRIFENSNSSNQHCTHNDYRSPRVGSTCGRFGYSRLQRNQRLHWHNHILSNRNIWSRKKFIFDKQIGFFAHSRSIWDTGFPNLSTSPFTKTSKRSQRSAKVYFPKGLAK